MKALFNKQIRVGVLLTAILALVALFTLVTDSTSDAAIYATWDDSEFEYSDANDDSWRNQDPKPIAPPAPGISAPVGAGKVNSPVEVIETDKSQDLAHANGLASELRRLVRAGRSMEALRTSSNPTQHRRCFDGMQKLRAEALSIRARRKNVAIPVNQPVSLNKVLNNIMKCVSCDGDAKKACDLAQKDLDIVVRSLSLN